MSYLLEPGGNWIAFLLAYFIKSSVIAYPSFDSESDHPGLDMKIFGNLSTGTKKSYCISIGTIAILCQMKRLVIQPGLPLPTNGKSPAKTA